MDKKIIEKIKKLRNKRAFLSKQEDELLGEYKLICGYCYHDDSDNWEDHEKQSPNCHRMAWPCKLGIHTALWKKDEEGRYQRDVRLWKEIYD